MDPFKKRATEFIEDPMALLALISPQPIRAFFDGGTSNFFDRLVIVVGTPGSGKTTISRLLEFTSLSALTDLASRDREVRELVTVLGDCGVLQDMRPKYLG